MKVLALNASPNEESGNTSLILNPYIEGMKAAGAETELIYLNRLTILPCRECTDDINFDSKGYCDCDDDMNMLYPKFRESDIWVFATPNYYDGMVPKLKHMLDRMEPLFNLGEDFSYNNGFTGKLSVVSTCDLYEMDNFEIITSHFQSLSSLFAREYSGALLRPHVNALIALKDNGNSVDDIFESAREAGRQIIEAGNIKKQTQDAVSRRLVPRKSFFAELGKFTDKNLSFA